MSAPFNLNKSTLGQREKDTPGNFREAQGMPYLDSSPSNYGTEGGDDKKKKETKEERGKRVYEEAMARIKAQKQQSEARKKMPKKKSILPRITSGMGSSFTTYND
jgi:hypothetical protein